MISSTFDNMMNQEPILTAPELPSMSQSDIEHSRMFSDGTSLFQSSEEYQDHHHHHFHPYQFRHSYQPATAHEENEASRYLMMVNHFANHFLDSSVNTAFEMSASSRGIPPATFQRRRTQSFDAHSTLTNMAGACMDAPIPYGCFYGETMSLPGSPSSSSSSAQMHEPDFSPNMMVDGQPHPFYMPVTTAPSHGHHLGSPSPSLSNSFQSTFPSPMSGASTCNSPSLSSPSPVLVRKRFSTDSNASQETAVEHLSPSSCPTYLSASNCKLSANKKIKQRYICHFPNCNRTFSRPYNLKSHGLTHDIHRPHACEKCSKTFARIHDRDRHMNSHMPQKPHVCIVCMGRFARQDAVIRHLKLSKELNACSFILKSKGISFRDAAAGRATRESLGEESEIREAFETLEEHARKTRATRTLEMVGAIASTD
ncbi:hypothetical protein BGZ65_007136 [Modicella reniformis]|uniref:C2H2-type domain-containing protein n=1 Tax=Modicella reniformis TaxID=1440133 RepID=A0A9P6IX95_9FUNG|nr:hypothetical protein BGZ65_007136 [Modicella reniformis]